MGLGIQFTNGPEKILVKIRGADIKFVSSEQGMVEASIEHLKLSHAGVVEEFPDLVDAPNWREQAIKRFKSKMKDYDTDAQRGDYIVAELSKHGYKPERWQMDGHRVKKFNGRFI